MAKAKGNEIATAYLALVPTLKGAKSTIEKELDGVGLEKIGSKKGASFGSSIAGAAKAGIATLAATAATAAASVGAIGKAALDSYAEYEQLVGGVDTLFKDSSAKVQEYAANAYKTAGMSANDYMSTVTSFSASLLQSLGGDTEAAASYADMAITDMSDNANKMGTDISMIQNAYQGFAKQNYTMLDNLKLGYGGTQEEMKRLLKDASAISGIDYDISSYADVVDAIHVIQTEMGITGTTALEASATIEGSVASMQAAWSNWLTGLADENADLEALTNQLVDSVATAAGNIIPRIGTIVSSLGSTLMTQLPVVLNDIVNYVVNNADSMIKAGMEFFGQFLAALGQVGATIVATLAVLLVELLDEIGSWVDSMLQEGLELAAGLITGIIDGIKNAASQIWEAIKEVFSGAINNVLGFFGVETSTSSQTTNQTDVALGYAPVAAAVSGGSDVTNVYIDGLNFNDEPAIRESCYGFLTELKQYAVAQGGV